MYVLGSWLLDTWQIQSLETAKAHRRTIEVKKLAYCLLIPCCYNVKLKNILMCCIVAGVHNREESV